MSATSRLIISGIGAAVGYYFGGSTGAQLGWALGGYAAASQEEIRQDTVGELKIQTASYGTVIAKPRGVQRVVGNIIWAAEKKPYDIKSKQGKGGPTSVNTGYTISMLIGICEGPIVGISKIWADGKLLIDSSVDVKPLIGELYLGTMTQNPDPTYESAVGAGNAPAYRGLAYFALTDFDLGVQGRVPNLSFEVIRGAA